MFIIIIRGVRETFHMAQEWQTKQKLQTVGNIWLKLSELKEKLKLVGRECTYSENYIKILYAQFCGKKRRSDLLDFSNIMIWEFGEYWPAIWNGKSALKGLPSELRVLFVGINVEIPGIIFYLFWVFLTICTTGL